MKTTIKTDAKLNTSETAVLQALANVARDTTGYDFGFTDEVDYQSLGLTKNQYAGYVSQITTKRYIFASDCETAYGWSVQFTLAPAAFVLLGIADKDPMGEAQKLQELMQKSGLLTSGQDSKTAKSRKERKMKTAKKTTKTVAKKTVKTAAKKSNGLRKPQLRILQALLKGKSLTRQQLAAKAPVDAAATTEYIGSLDPSTREANDKKHFPSLISLKALKVEQHDVNGKDVIVFAITAAGKKLAK